MGACSPAQISPCGSLIMSKCGQWGRGGTLWTAETVAEANNWTAVCWAPGNTGIGGAIANPGIFVAVASAGTHRVMTSPDGINWTPQTAAEANSWAAVCWAPGANSGLGLFVAVAKTGIHRVMTSPDGINWTVQTAVSARPWRGVAWSPTLNLFVACADVSAGTGTCLMYSSDGATWHTCTAKYPVNNTFNSDNFTSVCWSPELAEFCVVVAGSSAYCSILSTDGINFTGPLVSGYMHAVCWSPALTIFCAVHNDPSNGVIYTSATGAGNSWTGASQTTPHSLDAIAWSPDLGLFCAVGNSGALTSTNATSWTVETSVVPAKQFNGVCWSHELNIFCAVGNQSVMIRRQ